MKNLHQKVYAIVKKDSGAIVSFGLTKVGISNEWSDYYLGTPEESTHILQETFMSQSDIKKEMGI